MRRTHRPGRRGHTLTEMMLVVAILGIIASVGPPLMIGLQNFFLMTSARYETQRDARACLDTINRFLRESYSSSIVIDTPAGQGIYSHITFSLVDGRQMQFKQSGRQLIQMVTNAAGTQTVTTTLTKNLIYIAFTFPETDNLTIVSVAITMGKTIQLGRQKVLELTVQNVRVMN
jgi:prepilin-type N-terminal cleavage/methylation domain-containing protein